MPLEIRTKYKITAEDIDAQEHLNNVSCIRYFDKARIKLQEKFGLEESKLMEQGIKFEVCEANYRYKKEIMPNSEIEIHSYFKPYDGGLFIKMVHKMYVNNKLAVLAKTRNVFAKGGFATDPLEEFIEKFY